MAITYPLFLPLKEFAEIRLLGQSVVAETRSQFTLEGQTQVFPGQTWQAQVAYPTLNRDEAEPIIGFLLALNGREGTFLLGDPINVAPRGAAVGFGSSPLVNGAGQVGQNLAVRSTPPSLTNWLAVGDMLQIGPDSRARLHKVVQQVDTTEAGTANITIWPALRGSPADGETVRLSNTQGLFKLNQSGSEWLQQPPFLYELGFSAIEAI